MTRFSIIIPSYGRIDKLKNCLKNIARNNFDDREIIIVNDGYSLFPEESIKSLSNNIAVINQTKQSGPAVARNLGAKKASGEILIFLDSDVYINEATLKQLDHLFVSDPGVDVIQVLYAEKCLNHNLSSQFKHLSQIIRISKLKGKDFIVGTSCLAIKKRTFTKTTGFPVSPDFKGNEDRVFATELLRLKSNIHYALNIRAEHDHYLSFRDLIKIDIKRTVSEMNMMLSLKQLNNTAKGKSYIKLNEVLAMLLAPTQILLAGMQQFELFAACLALYLALQHELIRLWWKYSKNILLQYFIILADHLVIFSTASIYSPVFLTKKLLVVRK